MKSPRILVTNDDGIDSPGIYALWKAMSKVGTPTVIAPTTEQSAASHSITLNKPLFINYISRDYGFEGWSVDGTPADCTKIGINEVLKQRPDLIISGINCGANLGVDLIYSGTVSAATEGALLGIPSIAISLASFKTDDYRASKIVAIEMAKHVLKNKIPKGTLLNVNVPYADPKDIKGKLITRQGSQYFMDEFEKRIDPRENTYYWLKGKKVDNDNSDEYDGKAIKNNYISITPISFDLTNELYLNDLKKINE